MYTVTAVRSANRVHLSRTGIRTRRFPQLVLVDGSTIKLSPGRSVKITEDIFKRNLELLNTFIGSVEVRDSLGALIDLEDIHSKVETIPPQPVSEPELNEVSEPIIEVEEPVQEEVIEEPVQEVVVEEPVQEEVIEVPKKEVKPAPKKRRKRRTRAQIEAEKKEKEAKK